MWIDILSEILIEEYLIKENYSNFSFQSIFSNASF